jgi:hypothetical protein
VLKSESQAEFDALLNGLREDFQPVSTMEEGLVEMLAGTQWRRRRLLVLRPLKRARKKESRAFS